jgi:hypothetical protein
MRYWIVLIVSFLTIPSAVSGEPSLARYKCEAQLNEIIGLWGLGSIDHPKGNKRTVNGRVIIGHYDSRRENGQILDFDWTEKERRARGKSTAGMWEGNAQIIPNGEGVSLIRGGLIGSGRPPVIGASLTYVEPLRIDFNNDCELTRVTYKFRYQDYDLNKKPVYRESSVSLSAAQCRRIHDEIGPNVPGELVSGKFEKIVGARNEGGYRSVPLLWWIPTPEESALNNCRTNGVFYKLTGKPYASPKSQKPAQSQIGN